VSDILNNYFGEAMQQYLPKYELGKVYTLKSINEGPAVKKLRIFDFDDTLIKVKSSIHVKNNEKKFILTPAEFAVYSPKKGDVFNFKEFDAIIKTFAPIQTNLNLLKQSAGSPTTKTTILTARLLGFPVKYFLKKNFGLDVYVIALGSSDPQKKANYIEKEIKKGYNDIVFIDDSPKNVQAVEALQTKYPNVNLKVIHTTEAEHIKF
jgi:phosphoglycolate phosphatase-like HAD superfamily hydrolase